MVTKVTPEFKTALDLLLVDVGMDESEYLRRACEEYFPRFVEFVEAYKRAGKVA